MAARKIKIRHDDETRLKIQTSQLINRLQDHVFKDVEISATQLKAIEILLKKTLPDLSHAEIQPLDENGEKTRTEYNINIHGVAPVNQTSGKS